MTPRSAAERGPGTAAGRELSKAWRVRDRVSPGLNEAWPEQFDRYILAIEAEAATAAVPLDVNGIVAELMGVEAHLDEARERLIKANATLARLASADEEGGTPND